MLRVQGNVTVTLRFDLISQTSVSDPCTLLLQKADKVQVDSLGD